MAAAVLAGGRKAVGSGRFEGGRIGRGGAIARLLGSAAHRTRRVVIKTRLARLGGKGLGAAKAHLRYIQRDGVTRDGRPGELYGRDDDIRDGRAFLARSAEDRHQFRFIVSAEDGGEYDDLKPLTRRLMTQMEKDLGTKLDWIAADHLDTGHPHTHIILRGTDDRGENLVISRAYIAHGMRERAAELVTLDLGPRQDWEIRRNLRREIAAERLTSIDRGLVRGRDSSGTVPAAHRDPFQHALRAGRLKKLGALGLAEPLGGGKWRLAADIERQLRRLGERGDIIRTMQRELTAQGLERLPADRSIHDDEVPKTGILGRVIARGLVDELEDRHFLLVDGVDGRVHHVDIGRGEGVEPLPEGAIVRVRPGEAGPRRSDRLVAEIAGVNGGLYSVDLHLMFDPAAGVGFAEAHVRRLEAIRRGGGRVERLEDGMWLIQPDHLAQVAAFEQRRMRFAPVRVEMVSALPLARLPERVGATWLDQLLGDERSGQFRDAGFGREVRSALSARRRWLVAQGLGEEIDGHLSLKEGSVRQLRQREVAGAASQLSQELGLSFVPIEKGQRVEGFLRRRVDLASGRFALVEDGREFTLVPWRSMLEHHIDKQVSGLLRHDGISWSIGRGRNSPTIS